MTVAIPFSDGGVAASAGDPLDALIAGWLVGFASPHTRAAYRHDASRWLAFCGDVGVAPLTARRADVDSWARLMEADGLAASTVARRLAAASSWYSWLVAEGVVEQSPLLHVRRPRLSDESATLGPTREEAIALLAAAAELGPKYSALVSLLLLNGLRVSEALQADVNDLDLERGHRVLRIRRKGGKVATVPLAPRTAHALDACAAGCSEGPLFKGELRGRGTVGRLTSAGATYMVQRVTGRAALDRRFSSHSLRHGFVTLALEAGVSLTDVQDAAGHADPRTTRRYDRARHRLDSAATYTLAATLV